MDENENLNPEQNDKEAEAFNSMLNAAQKKLGIDGSQGAEQAAEGDAPADAPSEEEKKPAGVGSKLTQKQIEALLNDDDDASAGGEAPADGEAPAGADGASAEAGENGELHTEGLDDIDAETEEIASILGANISKSTQDDEEEQSAPLPPEPIKPKKNILGFIITIAAVVVALALGFCVSMLMFSDVIKSDTEQFAIRAANAVNSKLPLNTELYVFRAFVRKGATAEECMLYYATSYDSKLDMAMCKVSVSHDKPNVVNIYYTVDEDGADYLAMKNSDDAQVRLQASFLKNYSDSVYAADRQIQIKSPQWEKIDCTKVNRNITSEQVKNAAPAQTTAKPAPTDSDDIADLEEQ